MTYFGLSDDSSPWPNPYEMTGSVCYCGWCSQVKNSAIKLVKTIFGHAQVHITKPTGKTKLIDCL